MPSPSTCSSMADTRSTLSNVTRSDYASAVVSPIRALQLRRAMRELVSYYPQNMRPSTELLMTKVKPKLPAYVAAQLNNAEFMLNRTLTYEEFYGTVTYPLGTRIIIILVFTNTTVEEAFWNIVK